VAGIVGAILLVLGFGLGVGPANAQGGDHEVSPNVSFHDPTCGDRTAGWAGQVDGNADTAGDGVTFQVTAGAAEPGHDVTVTATAEAGYTFAGGVTTKSFTHTYGAVPQDCGQQDVVVTPTVVFHNPDAADHTASWTGYVNGAADTADDHVTFAVTSGTVAPGATVTITATAEAGYVFPCGDTTKTFTHTFTEVPGQDVTVTPTVEFHNPTAEDNTASWTGYVNGVKDTAGDHVTFEVTAGTVAPGATVTITATAEAGYVFPGGETTKTFTHTFTEVSGNDVVVTPTVKFHNPTPHHKAGWTGYVNGVKDTAGDHVTFEVTAGTVAPGATVTITATAEAGYVFPGGGTTKTFTHTFTQATGHHVVLVVTVRFHNATAHHKAGWTGYVNGVKDTAGDHVTFRVTAGTVAPGATVTVTATAENGFVLRGGTSTKTFTHTFAKVSGSTSTSVGHTGSTVLGHTSGQTLAGQTYAGQTAAGQGGVPTAVEAGQGGEQGGGLSMALPIALMASGGALLLIASGSLVTRKPRAGAHRA
jgi:hypothetical protein